MPLTTVATDSREMPDASLVFMAAARRCRRAARREAGRHCLGLDAKLGQLLCVFGGQAFHEASANTAKSSTSRQRAKSTATERIGHGAHPPDRKSLQ